MSTTERANTGAEKERRMHGVPLIDPVVDALRRVSAPTGVPFE